MDNIDRARKSEQGGKEKKNAFVAAIDGLSGAGKTALVEKVAQALGGAVTFYYDAIALIYRRTWIDSWAWTGKMSLSSTLRLLAKYSINDAVICQVENDVFWLCGSFSGTLSQSWNHYMLLAKAFIFEALAENIRLNFAKTYSER